MRTNGGIEKENDRLVQVWASLQKSYISGSRKNIVGHHFYSRGTKLLRWDIRNIIPLTFEEHADVHNGKLSIEIKNPFREKFLDEMSKKNFKDYLLENNLTEKDFAIRCNKKLKEKISEVL